MRRLPLMDLFDEFALRAKSYEEGLQSRRVFPPTDALKRLRTLDVPLQDDPLSPEEVLSQLDEIGSPATVASSGGRYYKMERWFQNNLRVHHKREKILHVKPAKV